MHMAMVTVGQDRGHAPWAIVTNVSMAEDVQVRGSLGEGGEADRMPTVSFQVSS